MNLHSVIQLILVSAPMVTALTSLILLLVTYQEKATPISGSTRKIAIAFYLTSLASIAGIVFYSYSSSAFAFFIPFHFGALLAVPILLYHLVWILTPGVNPHRNFNRTHYLFPILTSLVLLTWSSFISFEVRTEIAQQRMGTIAGYGAYFGIIDLRMEVRLLMNIGYLILSLRRVHKFRKIAIHSEDKAIYTKRWIRLLTALLIVTLSISVVGVIRKDFAPYKTVLPIITGFALGILHIELAFRLIKGYFPSKKPAVKKDYGSKIIISRKEKSAKDHQAGKKLSHSIFQAWIKKHKPYLDPSFTINDLSEALDINRTYISNFINETYGMNFSRYLNQLRFKELQRLTKLPSNKSKTDIELAQRAGFGSERNYRRIKKLEEGDNPKTDKS